MATYYVRKTGLDTNSGLTPALALLTITKALTLSTTGDTIYVGAGTYDEAPPVASVFKNNVTLIGDVMGTYTGDKGLIVLAPSGSQCILFNMPTTITGFQAYSIIFTSVNGFYALNLNNATAKFYNCIFTGTGYGLGTNAVLINCTASGGTYAQIGNYGAATCYNSILLGTTEIQPTGTNNLVGAAGLISFENTVSNNFRPLIGNSRTSTVGGTTTVSGQSIPTTDILGNTRTAAPWIGAYDANPREKTSIANVTTIGDKIICEYVAGSGTLGTFSKFGTSNATLIPPESSATPNGSFYYIYVGDDNLGRKILIADRNTQSSITWDNLNSSGVASGSGLPITTVIASPPMTSNTAPSGVASASGLINGNWQAWNAFNQGYVDPDTYNGWIGATIDGGWLQYQFPTSKKILSYAITNLVGANNVRYLRAWSLQASNTGLFTGEQVTLDSQTGMAFGDGERKKFNLINTVGSYLYYRIVPTNSGGTYEAGIGELELLESFSETANTTVRLLTGGVSSTDKDDEWDKYIANSTLNGTITAGDNNVWNWNYVTMTWTSTTGANSSYRVVRGYSNNVNYYSSAPSNDFKGFRPVLIVENTLIPSIFKGSLSPNPVHFEDTLLTGTITNSASLNVQYKISVNGTQVFPASGYTALAPTPINISQTILNSALVPGSNSIVVDMLDSSLSTSSTTLSLTLSDSAPTINVTMTNMTLNVTINDPDADTITYDIKLNGSSIYTEVNQVVPPISYTRTFRSYEINVGSTNTVLVTATDQLGKVTTSTITFTGAYSGLMFADPSGNYYTTDQGAILKLLDIGSLVAGQVSAVFQVYLANKNSFSVSNIMLSKNIAGMPPTVILEISEGNAPFVSVASIAIPGPLVSNSQIAFYVRISTSSDASGIGNFEIDVKGDPS